MGFIFIFCLLSISYASSCSIDCSVKNNRIFVGEELKINCTANDAFDFNDITITAARSNVSAVELPNRTLDNRTVQGYISHVGLQDSGWYSCCRNGCTNAKGLSNCCRVQVQELLQPPRNFTCTSIDGIRMNCSWTELDQCPDDHTPCWNFSFTYFVYYILSDTGELGTDVCSNRTKNIAVKNVSECTKSDGQVTCKISGDPYQVNSLYYMYLEAGNQEYKYEICNDDSILKLALRKLEVVATSSTSIDVTWEMSIAGSEITCKINATSQWGTLFTKSLHYGNQHPKAASYTLVDLHPYTEYTVQVQCSVTASVYPGKPKVGRNRTHPSAPLIGPIMTNTSYVSCGKQCTMFYLQEPSLYFAQGNLSGFTLQQDNTFIFYNLTSNIKVNHSSSMIKIWSENISGRSKAATEVLVPADGEEFTEIAYVHVTHNSLYKHYTIKCHLVDVTKRNIEYVFHQCSGTFTTQDQLCLGTYNFTTSSKNEMNISSESSDETFGVSIAAPVQSQGIHWQDISDHEDPYEPATVHDAVRGGDNYGVIAAAVISAVLLLLVISVTGWKCRGSQSNYDIDIPEIKGKNKSNGLQQHRLVELMTHRTLSNNMAKVKDVNELTNGSLSSNPESETSFLPEAGYQNKPLLHNENRAVRPGYTLQFHDGYCQERPTMDINSINQPNAEDKASNSAPEPSAMSSGTDNAYLMPHMNSYSRITHNYSGSCKNESDTGFEVSSGHDCSKGRVLRSGSDNMKSELQHTDALGSHCVTDNNVKTYSTNSFESNGMHDTVADGYVSVVNDSDSKKVTTTYSSISAEVQNIVDSDHYVTVAINPNNSVFEVNLRNPCTVSIDIHNKETTQEYLIHDKAEITPTHSSASDAGQMDMANSYVVSGQQGPENESSCTQCDATAMQISSEMHYIFADTTQDNTGTFQISTSNSLCESEGDKPYVLFSEPAITRNIDSLDSYVTTTQLNVANPRLSASDDGHTSTSNANVMNREQTSKHDFICSERDKTTIQIFSDRDSMSEEISQDQRGTLPIPTPNTYYENRGDNLYISNSEPAIDRTSDSSVGYVTATMLTLTNHIKDI